MYRTNSTCARRSPDFYAPNKPVKQLSKLSNSTVFILRDSFARLAGSIEAPTLILWGKQDRIINVEVAKELKYYSNAPKHL